jgi:peptidyl-prolyl cis-trans isomerase D
VDWVVRGQMVPEFEQASFNTKVGEISGVVKTVYGFHILKVEGKEAARLKPLEEVRAELTKELSASQVAVRMQSAAEQVRSALIRSAAEAEKVAAQNGVRVVRVEKAGGTDPVPEVGVNEDFRDAVAQLPKNGVTGVISISDAKTVVAQVTDVFPSRQAEYSEVEEQARAGVIAKKSTALFEEKVAELKKRLAEPGADLQKLAKEFGAEVKTPGEFGRDGAVEGVGPATLMEEGFSKGVGEVFGPVRISGGQAFACKVADKIPADLTALAAQREQLVQAIKSRKAKERRDLFADGVLKRMIDQKKVKINNTVVQRIAASYRGA